MAIDVPQLEPCPFCEYLAGALPCALVTTGDTVSSLMNRTQYERGALLVMPNAHVATVLDADADLVADVYREAQRMARALVDMFAATGVNIYQNNGIVAGQTVPHYHVHVVPRYPSSDPAKRFREADYPPTPIEELHALATALKAGLT
jgi:histidine triad (HIT) family protein